MRNFSVSTTISEEEENTIIFSNIDLEVQLNPNSSTDKATLEVTTVSRNDTNVPVYGDVESGTVAVCATSSMP